MTRYYQWDYDKGIVSEYVRSGECTPEACGAACCKAVIQLHAYVYDSKLETPRDGGYGTNEKGVWNEVVEDGRRRFFQFAPIDASAIEKGHRCPLLTQENRCGIYNARQKVCTTWPTSPDQVEALKGCGYRFEKIGEWKIEELRKEQGEERKLGAVEESYRSELIRGFR